MHSASKTWPSRLLATAVALVLVVAYVVGAFAHAAGHPAHPAHAAAVAEAGDRGDQAFAAAATAPEHNHARGHADGGHDEDRPSHSLDCCDTICHGGQAILGAVPVVAAALPAAPFIAPTAALHGADPGGLDRPPKPFRSA